MASGTIKNLKSQMQDQLSFGIFHFTPNGITSIDSLPNGFWIIRTADVVNLTDKPSGVSGRLFVWQAKEGDEYFTMCFSPNANALFFRTCYGSLGSWWKIDKSLA